LKRALQGTYVSVEPFHLFRYVDDEVSRFNNRDTHDGHRFRRAAGRPLASVWTYDDLTGTTLA
jgi:hypothetical protein